MKIFNIDLSKDEIQQISNRQFTSLEPLILDNYSRKMKNKAAILYTIAQQFHKGTDYSEKQINEILKPIYPDYATIRRDLYEARFLEREPDGSKYWVGDHYSTMD